MSNREIAGMCVILGLMTICALCFVIFAQKMDVACNTCDSVEVGTTVRPGEKAIIEVGP